MGLVVSTLHLHSEWAGCVLELDSDEATYLLFALSVRGSFEVGSWASSEILLYLKGRDRTNVS